VYVAPSVYADPPLYQRPAPSAANYRLLAPSGSHLVAHVQEKLRGYGYYRSAVDGVLGAGTRSAIRAYQVDRGIRVTGRIDQELLSDLGL
jgi:peptidoglycan hydrolase-like protein with peptidoglycan-binding domain